MRCAGNVAVGIRHSILLCALVAWPAAAQQSGAPGSAPAADEEEVPTIIVTARKFEEAASTVGMSITAAAGDELRLRGIDSVADLPLLVPGLTVQESAYNSTSFTLRGVGFFNSDLATPPAVTFYLDEAPLPYPAMTRLAAFDLERVEVLKGPQGTLYGQNATGGAVNLIAARPPQSLELGAQATFGRFNRLLLGGFAGGPLAEGLLFRVAVQGRRGDPWQESVTRPGDRLGRVRELQGRAALEWQRGGRLTSRLTFTLTHDESDSRAAQFIAPAVLIPPLAVPELLTFPVVTQPRSADWAPSRPDTGEPFPYASDTTLYHLAWRTDYRLADQITLTALTSYARFRFAYGQDPDGTPFHISEVIDRGGRISAFHQEVRLRGQAGRLDWLVGANYARDRVEDRPVQFFGDNDVARLFLALDPLALADRSRFEGSVRATTYAAFGRAELEMGGGVTVELAGRYNVDRRRFDNCGYAVTDSFARFWNFIRAGAEPPTRVGDCYILDPADGFRPVTNVSSRLDEDSVSWRTGVNWTVRPGLLLYANASRGYKAGAVPVLAASTVAQFRPVGQESLLAFEAGVKASLFRRRVQLDAAVFHYDYRDKQLRGATLDPTFGPLEALVSIPRSHVNGIEIRLVARPIPGLVIDTAATFVDTEIDRFTGFDALARFGDQSGTPFPFSPRWQSVTNVNYEFPLTGRLTAFIGGSLTYNSRTYAGVGARDLLRIDDFALLDLRAGVDLGAGRYRLWAWGRNVGGEYYWSNVFANGNTVARFGGQPATYGLSFAGRF